MSPFFARWRRERDLDEEIKTHIRMAIEERVARGESRAEAERSARREFGDVTRVKEATRTMWGGVWLDRALQDIRLGVRSLARDRGFTLVAVLTLALGVGVTTAMFTVVNGVMFRPLPFFEPDRLVAVANGTPGQITGSEDNVLDEHFQEIKERFSAFTHVYTNMIYPPATLTGAGEPVRATSAYVTAEFLDVLGIRPALGRGFRAADDQVGASPVVVLGNGLWRSRFGADPDIVGTTATLDGVARTIVGIMPPGNDFPDRAELWLPMQANPFLEEGLSWANPVVGRLAEDIRKGSPSTGNRGN